jgi:hypothetical protein
MTEGFCNLVPGQVVVCVDASWPRWAKKIADMMGITYPVEGQVYTVREVCDYLGDVCVRLHEIVNPEYDARGNNLAEEHAFLARRFRPAKQTSIESLESLLSPTPEMEDA